MRFAVWPATQEGGLFRPVIRVTLAPGLAPWLRPDEQARFWAHAAPRLPDSGPHRAA
jgi:hypothetical protein